MERTKKILDLITKNSFHILNQKSSKYRGYTYLQVCKLQQKISSHFKIFISFQTKNKKINKRMSKVNVKSESEIKYVYLIVFV